MSYEDVKPAASPVLAEEEGETSPSCKECPEKDEALKRWAAVSDQLLKENNLLKQLLRNSLTALDALESGTRSVKDEMIKTLKAHKVGMG